MEMQIAENKIKEVLGGQNVVYEVNNSFNFMLIGFKVLKSQNDNCFAQCSRFDFNGKIRLMYFTGEFKPLSTFISSIDSSMFLRIIADLLNDIIRIKHNGFLLITNIAMDADKIFVDPMTMNAKLLYLPVSFAEISEEKAEAALRMTLINIINRSPNLYNSTVAAFSAELTNSAKTIDDLYAFLENNGMVMRKSPVADTGMPNNGSNMDRQMNHSHQAAQPELYFSTINSIYSVSFVINKPRFSIGKNELMVDGAVTFNGAISRKHCEIVYEDGQYFIEDSGSANGTFVNNYPVQSGTRQPLQRGDIVKLANSEFVVEF